MVSGKADPSIVKTTSCLEEQPHAFVRYFDTAKSEEAVPVCNIPSVEGSGGIFTKATTYSIFWYPTDSEKAPIKNNPKTTSQRNLAKRNSQRNSQGTVDKVLTYPEYKAKFSEVSTFPANTGNSQGPGFYPGEILAIGSCFKEVMMKVASKRISRQSEKAVENSLKQRSNGPSGSSASSSSSGIESSLSSSSKRKHPGNNSKNQKNGNKKHRSIKASNREGTENNDEHHDLWKDNEGNESKSGESSDSDLDSPSASKAAKGAEVSAKIWEEKINYWQEKYSISDKRVKQLNEKLLEVRGELDQSNLRNSELEAERDKIISLNIRYQQHIVSCCSLKPAAKEKETPVEVEVLRPTKPVQMPVNNGAPMADRTAAAVQQLCSSPPIIAAQDHSKSADEQQLFETDLSASHIEILFVDNVEENSLNEPRSHTTTHHDTSSKTDIVTEIQLPSTSDKAATHTFDEGSDAQSKDGDCGKASHVSAPSDTVEIHPNIFVSRDAMSSSFRSFVGNPLSTYVDGPDGDKRYVQDAAVAMFSTEELATHTVTGKASNAHKNLDTPVQPPLDEKKMQAIYGALLKRVTVEKEKVDAAEKNDPRNRPPVLIAERVKRSLVNKYVGNVVHNVQKRMKRSKKTV